MTRKFLGRGAIADLVRSADRTNSLQKREGLSRHPARTVMCGCPDKNCGGWHVIDTHRTEPDGEEAATTLKAHSQEKKAAKRYGRMVRTKASDGST